MQRCIADFFGALVAHLASGVVMRQAVFSILGCLLLSSAIAAGEPSEPSSSAWEALRARYYGDKPMGMVDENFMSVEAPANTPDPSATPLTLRFADDAKRRIKQVRVFIDNNPSPLVATFDMGAVPLTEIDMRVRIDRFTSVRAIAELTDGQMEMRSTWVKAAGGCSAPPANTGAGKLSPALTMPMSAPVAAAPFFLDQGSNSSII